MISNEQKYEQMATFNMSMVRYYADKCGTVGLYDAFDCNFKPLEIKKQNVQDKIKKLNEDFV